MYMCILESVLSEVETDSRLVFHIPVQVQKGQCELWGSEKSCNVNCGEGSKVNKNCWKRRTHLNLMNEYLHIKGGVKVYHGICWVEDHSLSQDLVDLACAQSSKWPVWSSRQPQLPVLTNALKHLHRTTLNPSIVWSPEMCHFKSLRYITLSSFLSSLARKSFPRSKVTLNMHRCAVPATSEVSN